MTRTGFPPQGSATSLTPGRTVALLGDSIVQHCFSSLPLSGNAAFVNWGFWTWANIILGHRFNLVYADGQAATGCTQAGWMARVYAMIAASPQWCVLEIGVNDPGLGASAAQIIAAMGTTLAVITGAGINVVLNTISPNNSNQTTNVIGTVNTWIRQQGNLPGVVICDAAAVLTDPTSSTPGCYQGGLTVPNAYTPDGLHPSSLTAVTWGQALANALSFVPAASGLLVPASDASNIMGYGATSWAGGSTGLPTSWGVFDTVSSYSQTARTDLVPGVWQNVVIANGHHGEIYTTPSCTLVGHTVVGVLEFKTSNLDAAPANNTQYFSMALTANPGGAVVQDALQQTSGDWNCPPPASGVLCTPPMVLAAGTTSVSMLINMYGGGTYSLGRVGVLALN